MYHDSNTLLMAMKIEQNLREKALKNERFCRESHSRGKRNFKFVIHFGIRELVLEIRPRQVETA